MRVFFNVAVPEQKKETFVLVEYSLCLVVQSPPEQKKETFVPNGRYLLPKKSVLKYQDKSAQPSRLR